MTLTKANIVTRIESHLNISNKKSKETVEALLEIMKGSLASGEDLLISGFGRFCVKQKKERQGRNPATSENLMLRSRRVVTFKCSAKLKEKINRIEKSPVCAWARTQNC
jgi:integration host factor subunit alpha